MQLFLYKIQDIKFFRNQTVFREKEKLKGIYIIKKGEFEIQRSMKKFNSYKEQELILSSYVKEGI